MSESSRRIFRARSWGCQRWYSIWTALSSTVHEHVAAWSDALRSEGILAPNWKIHRHVGMSGRSFLRKLLRDIRPRRRNLSIDRLEKKHDINFGKSIRRIEIPPDLSSS